MDGSTEPVRGIVIYDVVIPLAELTYQDAFADEAWLPDGTGTFPTSVTFATAGAGSRVEVHVSFPDSQALRRAVELHMADGYAETLDRLHNLLETTRR